MRLDDEPVRITVYGRPQQKGSKCAMISNKTGKPMLLDDNPRAKAWQAAVSAAAGEAYSGPVMRGPVLLSATFVFARPKAHFRTGKHAAELRDDAPRYHAKTPDVDKIVRTCLDGLKGVVFADDKQVQLGPVAKLWGDQDVSHIEVSELEEV